MKTRWDIAYELPLDVDLQNPKAPRTESRNQLAGLAFSRTGRTAGAGRPDVCTGAKYSGRISSIRIRAPTKAGTVTVMSLSVRLRAPRNARQAGNPANDGTPHRRRGDAHRIAQQVMMRKTGGWFAGKPYR